MRRLPIPKMAVGLLLAVLAVCALIGINETSYVRSTDALEQTGIAQKSRADVSRVLQLVLDAETGQRGYLLTGDQRYLEPYDSAIANLTPALDELRSDYKQAPQEMEVLELLSRQVQRKLSEMDLSIRMRKQGNEDAWKFVLTTDVGREHMDTIRSLATELVAATTARIASSREEITRSLQLSRIGIALVALVGLLSFAMYLRQTSALNMAGDRQNEILQRERDQLGHLVKERTATLAELATHLQEVREEERGHLARELHDELGALLTAAKLDVARLKSRLPKDIPDAGDRLQHLTDTLNSGIALKRRIIEDLRPSSLSNLGLISSLEILTREFADRSGIEITTEFEACDLSDAAQLTVYRIVQESLTNIAKYANATQAEVVLSKYDSHVVLAVKDNGAGFSLSDVKASSHGLAGMRHRVEAHGGKLTVSSAPGAGTKISAVLPKESRHMPNDVPAMTETA